MEHLAILKRWYYRGSRTGEIFFADAKGELPMRRIVRGISRVFRGEKPDAESNSPAASAVKLTPITTALGKLSPCTARWRARADLPASR